MIVRKNFVSIICAGWMMAAGISTVFGAQNEEMATGYRPADIKIESPQSSEQTKGKSGKSVFESKYDSRDKGYITSVKSQGNTGLCWSFSTIAAAEASLIKNGYANNSIDLSEKHLGYFSLYHVKDPLGNTSGDKIQPSSNWANIGGNNYITAVTLSGWKGLAQESLAPFKAPWSVSSSYAYNKSYILKNSYFLGDDFNKDVIKSAIKTYGAVSAAYYADNSMDEAYISRKTDSSSNNHVITIVGWDDNYLKTNFKAKTPKNNGAWIVKNSWGTQYQGHTVGRNGYYYISYEERSLSDPVVYEVTKASQYQNNYFYDGTTGLLFGKVSRGDRCAAVYTAKKGSGSKRELVKAVNLTTGTPNVKYSIQVYKNPTKGKPTSGTKMLSKPASGTLTYAGTHTIDLPKEVEVIKGDRFSVVVTFNSSAELGVDQSYHDGYIKYTNKTASDQSYWYINSAGGWGDMNQIKASYRLKAYTVNKSTSQVHLRYCKTSKVTRTYTGKNIKPTINLYYNGKKLKKNRDYTVTCKKRKSTGRSYMIFKGKSSKFRGTRKVYFYVVPKKVKISSLKCSAKGSASVKFKKTTGASGYQISYRKKGTKKYINVYTKSSQKTIKKLSSRKKYYIKIRAYKTVSGKRYYGSYSKVKSVSLK